MNQTHMSELNDGQGADIDLGIMPLVKFLNKLGLETIGSGAPHEASAYVEFVGDADKMADFLFHHFQPMIAHLENHVRFGILYDVDGYEGFIYIDPEVLDEVTKRLGCWVEMLHK